MTDHLQQPLALHDIAPIASVEEYQFEPIKGYPTLKWQGKRQFRSIHYYPAQLRETHGPEIDGWRNKVLIGNNLQVMGHLLRTFRRRVKLVYIDPPFDSKADYALQVSLRGRYQSASYNAFEEKQYSDIWIHDEYLQFMYERLLLIKELMSNGSWIFLHCDQKKSHHLRCLLDEVFGPSAFVNEIIWQKTRVSKGQSISFGNIHDSIFGYRKGADPIFHSQYEAYSEDYVASHYNLRDENGRVYGLWDFTQAGQGEPRRFGDQVIVPPTGKHWIWGQDRIDEGMKKGLLEFTSSGLPRLRRYLDEAKGKRIGDIWTDVFDINSQAHERLDYPTQKPEALIHRIISTVSNPGDIVFDCFMGSGTTQAVAMKLGRRFIGVDINVGAVQITTKRLIQVAKEIGEETKTAKPNQKQIVFDEVIYDEDAMDDDSDLIEPVVFYTGFEVYSVNDYEMFRNPVEARDLLLKALEVQELPTGSLYDGTKDGRMVKIMPVNRIATRADLNDLIGNFDYRAFERRYADNPNQPVERITLVCMGHEPDLASQLMREVHPQKLDVEVFDVLRDGQHLQFKRDSEARMRVRDGWLTIETFYPMNLLQKLSLEKETVDDWRELVESVMIDWNYDGAVLTPAMVDIPDKNELVVGRYPVPADAGTIRVKITDLLSESWEGEVSSG